MNVNTIFQSWNKIIDNELEQELGKIIKDLRVEYYTKKVYPDKFNIFRAFREVNIDECNAVLIGMDPYHNIYNNQPSACGLSFVTENGFINPSLRILSESLNINPNDFKDFMLSRKVLLLNTYLTVEQGKPGSHRNIWSKFSKMLINKISRNRTDLNWILLGNDAKALKSEIISGNIHYSIHPAAYIYKSQADINPNMKYKELKNVWKDLKWI